MLKDGEFTGHVLHFQRFEMVSPKVKGYAKVVAIAEMEDRSELCRTALVTDKDLNDLLNVRELASVVEYVKRQVMKLKRPERIGATCD